MKGDNILMNLSKNTIVGVGKRLLAGIGITLAAFAFTATPMASNFGIDNYFVTYAQANPNSATDFTNIISIGSDGKITQNQSAGKADFADISNRYKNIIMAVTGFLTLTCFAAMILQITKLAASGDNEQARRKAIMGILTTGVGVALLGSATIVIGFFYGAISGSSGSSDG